MLCNRTVHHINTGVGCNFHTIKKEILELPPEKQQMLVRRARDAFNKHKGLQLEIVAHMILGKHIRFDNLDDLDIE